VSEVRARLARGRSIDVNDFADLTDVPVEEVDFDNEGALVVTFTGPVPEDIAAAVERRIVSRDATEETMRARIAEILAKTDPTADEIRERDEMVARIVLSGPTE
jgi:hypothetical protein